MLLLLIITRALHVTSSILLLAALNFELLVISRRALSTAQETMLEFSSGQQRTLTMLCIVVITSLLAWFFLSEIDITDLSVEGILAFITQTQFGRTCLFRGALLALFVSSLNDNASTRFRFWTLWVTAGLNLATIAFMGHSATGLGASGRFRLTSDICHLLVCSLWPGGLPFLARVLSLTLKSKCNRMFACAATASRRFSRLSIAAVLILATTGVTNAFFVLPGSNSFVSSSYFLVLLAKICLFITMVGIGAKNLSLVRIDLSQNQSIESGWVTIKQINHNIRLEIVLGTAILLAVGMLGSMPPPN